MSVEGVSSPGTGASSGTSGVSGGSPARASVGIAALPGAAGISGVGSRGADRSLVGFDPVAALVSFDTGAAGAPAAGLQAQLLNWVTPRTRQFETMQPNRLLPLLGMAVDRLAHDAPNLDELGWLGAAALERELRDHQAVAERRATIVES